MKYSIFPNSFFFKYKAPNAEEIIEKANSYSEELVDNSAFHWKAYHASDCIKLDWKDWIDIFKPTLNLLSKDLKSAFKYTMYNPWLNLYKRGAHQEVHDHFPCHLSMVFLVNDGPDFSKFYFLDRNSINVSHPLAKLSGLTNVFEPTLTAGDAIFFPSNLMHGVTPHNSDVIRRSISINLDIN